MAIDYLLDRLPSLIDSAAAVVGEVDLERVLRRLVAEARAATGAKYAALGVIGAHGVLSEFLHEGMSDEEVIRIGHLPVGRGVLGTVVRENQTLRLDDIADHPDSYGFPEHHPKMQTFLGVPVSVGGVAFGNLYLSEKEGGFTDNDVVVVEALSRVAGAAVNTARLHDRLQSVAVMEDRARIARDLHDSVIQDLFAVGLGLQGISDTIADSGAAETLEEAVDRLDKAVEALRSYIFQLRSDAASRQLDDRLQEIVSRMGSAYPTSVSLDMGVGSLGDELLEDEVVKIVSEALSNALRHSAGSRAEVAVDVDEGFCLISVVDDGVGFDRSKPSSGMGLANIELRSHSLRGTFEIESVPGSGTKIAVRLPLG
ncbi:MAG: GAF domain-containing sensor histidine kinase [Acidimicrobiia bacterium]